MSDRSTLEWTRRCSLSSLLLRSDPSERASAPLVCRLRACRRSGSRVVCRVWAEAWRVSEQCPPPLLSSLRDARPNRNPALSTAASRRVQPLLPTLHRAARCDQCPRLTWAAAAVPACVAVALCWPGRSARLTALLHLCSPLAPPPSPCCRCLAIVCLMLHWLWRCALCSWLVVVAAHSDRPSQASSTRHLPSSLASSPRQLHSCSTLLLGLQRTRLWRCCYRSNSLATDAEAASLIPRSHRSHVIVFCIRCDHPFRSRWR